VLINNVLFQSQRLENITGKVDTTSDDDDKIHTHYLIEKHNSDDNDYHELMTCLKKHHKLALESVLRKFLLSIIRTYNNNIQYYNMSFCPIFSLSRHVRILDSMFTYVTFIVLSLNVLILSVIGIQVSI